MNFNYQSRKDSNLKIGSYFLSIQLEGSTYIKFFLGEFKLWLQIPPNLQLHYQIFVGIGSNLVQQKSTINVTFVKIGLCKKGT